ncbi:aminotransferase class I/II-fold pyridoxal phosphate-dependent enzyme [Candidatus Woesearchaeota archaeon]|nr:aminotransferase class I/II-fold pyridoxal phosphate-dependent enzyme [Candidatus Woesearchaeota archaeon]
MTDYKLELEKYLANYLGLKYTVLFSSCRNALYTLLLSFNLKSDDEVMIQDFICDSLPRAVKLAGGKVVSVPVDEETFNLTAKEVKKRINKNTKAIIFVHTYGNPSGIKEIAELCKKHKIILIEDIAHALGAKYDGKLAGTFGDYAVYSFTKQMVNLGGGALITNRDVEKIKILKEQLNRPASKLIKLKRLFASMYESRAFFISKIMIDLARKKSNLKQSNDLDSHYECSNLEARMVLSQIKNLEKDIIKRKENYNFIKDKCKTQKIETKSESGYNYLVQIFQDKEKRDMFLRKNNSFLKPWPNSNVSEILTFVPNSPNFSKNEISSLFNVNRESGADQESLNDVNKNEKTSAKMKNNTKAVLLALLCTFIVSIAQILLKIGSEKFTISWTQVYNYPLLIGGLIYVAGAFIFIKAFRLGELSVVYPVMASGYIMVTLLSVYFFGEIVTLQKTGGIALITIGVVLIGIGGKK